VTTGASSPELNPAARQERGETMAHTASPRYHHPMTKLRIRPTLVDAAK
jgi:hypothetical protein